MHELLREGMGPRVVDYDDHLDDVQKDWLGNSELKAAMKKKH